MISALLPGTAFAEGEGGHIKDVTIFGGATWENGGRGGSPFHGSGQGGHLTGELDGFVDLNGGFGEGGSVVGDVHQGGGGGGCRTDPVSGERVCGKLPLDLG